MLLRNDAVVINFWHVLHRRSDPSLQPLSVGSGGFLLSTVYGSGVDAPAPLNQEPFLVAQYSRQPAEPLEDFDIVVADVTRVTKEACRRQGHDRYHRVHSCEKKRFVPSQV